MITILKFILKVLCLFAGIMLVIGFITGMLTVRKWFMDKDQIQVMEQEYKTDTTGKSNTWNYGTPKQHRKRKSN